jgi:hypothetical protein
MDEVDGFSHRESRYTKYYKLVIFIVDTIFILSLACSYCSNFTVAATDPIPSRRIRLSYLSMRKRPLQYHQWTNRIAATDPIPSRRIRLSYLSMRKRPLQYHQWTNRMHAGIDAKYIVLICH